MNGLLCLLKTSLGLLFLLESNLLGDTEVDSGLSTDTGNNAARGRGLVVGTQVGQLTQVLTAQGLDARHLLGDGLLAGCVVGLDDDVALGLDIVLCEDGTDSLGGVQNELICCLGGRVVELLLELGEPGSHD